MRILHVLDSLNVGGLENGVINLINRMDPNRFEHGVCCVRSLGPMKDRITRPDVPLFNMNVKKRDYLLPIKIIRVIRSFKPDIIHTRNFGTMDGIIAAALSGVKHVVHGEHGREFSDISGQNRKRNFVRRILFRKTVGIVAVSKDIETWLTQMNGVKKKKVRVITNGVDTEKYKPAANRDSSKSILGLDTGETVVVTVGRLDKVKNYPMLIESLQKVNTQKPFRVLVIGDGPERGALESAVREKGIKNIIFLGEKKNVADYLKASDIFVLTSVAEGISNTILEAMASGLPVIATRVGGNEEIVCTQRVGTLVPSKDPDALAQILSLYLNNPDLCKNRGDAARRHCMDNFSLAKMVQSYEDFYTTNTGRIDGIAT